MGGCGVSGAGAGCPLQGIVRTAARVRPAMSYPSDRLLQGITRMTADEAKTAVQAGLMERQLPRAAVATIMAAPYVLTDPDFSGSFRFFRTVPSCDGLPKGVEPQVFAAAFDTATGRLYYRDPAGFQDFVQALGLPGAATALTPVDLLTAWFMITWGTVPVIAEHCGRLGERIRQQVSAPTFDGEPTGAVLVGWTSDDRGWALERHTITLAPDGSVTATTERAETLDG